MIQRFVKCILFLSILWSCNSSSQKKGDIITFATLKGPSSMGMIKLIDSLEQLSDKKIKIEILNEPIQVRKMMLDGTADFAILPTTMAAILYNKGLDYKLAAIPVWGTLYLFGNDTTIKDWSHLKGKKVNLMGKGMTPDVLFRKLLKVNGLEPEKDVILDYSFPTHIDLANAVAAGQATLGVISEPLVSLVIQKNKDVKPIFDLNYEWEKVMHMPMAQTALLVKQEIIKTNRELTELVLKSYEFSTIWVNHYPDSASTLVVKYNILPDYEVANASIPRSNLKFVRAKSVRNQVEDYLTVFYKMNPDIIGGKIPDENFYY